MPEYEPTQDEIDAFKRGWKLADSLDLEGMRVKVGLMAAAKVRPQEPSSPAAEQVTIDRIDHLRQVVVDSGTNPNYHQAQVDRLRKEWPILWDAIESLVLGRDPKFKLTPRLEPECVERWPECFSGGYDPRCCRWPKSCSVRTEP